jgi:hypothetical protein
MSTLTLELPDALVAKLKERHDLNELAAHWFSRGLESMEDNDDEVVVESGPWKWEDISLGEKEAIERGLQSIRTGEEGIELDDYIALRRAERAQRNAA